VPETGIPLRRLLLRSLRTVDLSIHALLDPVRLCLSVPQAVYLLIRRRPAAIFTTGGYVAVPTLLAAAVLRVPVVMWEGNVAPGRSVRWTARLARCLSVSFPAACGALARGKPCFHTGTPIRDPGAVSRDEARRRMGVPAGERLVLIFGGSQAVLRFNSAVAEALPRLVERARVLHVTGEEGRGRPAGGGSGLRCRSASRCDGHPRRSGAALGDGGRGEVAGQARGGSRRGRAGDGRGGAATLSGRGRG
jgi:UDP-N-acetylglucosamine--N-acetylmuramyl-(pentapeptide) pyrophosphoryl-undecaprenol N-acetylglucosamine transferase